MMSLKIGWKVIPQILVSSEHEVVDSLEGKGFCGVDGDWDWGLLRVWMPGMGSPPVTPLVFAAPTTNHTAHVAITASHAASSE